MAIFNIIRGLRQSVDTEALGQFIEVINTENENRAHAEFKLDEYAVTAKITSRLIDDNEGPLIHTYWGSTLLFVEIDLIKSNESDSYNVDGTTGISFKTLNNIGAKKDEIKVAEKLEFGLTTEIEFQENNVEFPEPTSQIKYLLFHNSVRFQLIDKKLFRVNLANDLVPARKDQIETFNNLLNWTVQIAKLQDA